MVLALPGDYVQVGEKVEEAILDANIRRLLGVYSEPNRDPRFRVVSVVFVCQARGEPKAGDD
ncbi:MAG: hypothetical protein RMI44_06260 [Aquificaceae bacterium]|nr:hypothetical protein [Aquificaceae bacterium]